MTGLFDVLEGMRVEKPFVLRMRISTGGPWREVEVVHADDSNLTDEEKAQFMAAAFMARYRGASRDRDHGFLTSMMSDNAITGPLRYYTDADVRRVRLPYAPAIMDLSYTLAV